MCVVGTFRACLGACLHCCAQAWPPLGTPPMPPLRLHYSTAPFHPHFPTPPCVLRRAAAHAGCTLCFAGYPSALQRAGTMPVLRPAPTALWPASYSSGPPHLHPNPNQRSAAWPGAQATASSAEGCPITLASLPTSHPHVLYSTFTLFLLGPLSQAFHDSYCRLSLIPAHGDSAGACVARSNSLMAKKQQQAQSPWHAHAPTQTHHNL